MKLKDFTDLLIAENENYLIINKPPHVATLDERTADRSQNILRMARAYCETAQVCHRLDKETSGILAIAKHPEAYRHLSMQFEHRQVAKIYHAVTEGLHDLKDVSVNLPLLPLKTGIVRIDFEEGKEAMTVFKTMETFSKHTLVKCLPVTGRLHQIRVHLAYLKAPIVSDIQYGGHKLYLSELKKRNFKLKKEQEELPLINRVALHAHSLTFTDLDGEMKNFEAPYPKDINALLKQLRNF